MPHARIDQDMLDRLLEVAFAGKQAGEILAGFADREERIITALGRTYAAIKMFEDLELKGRLRSLEIILNRLMAYLDTLNVPDDIDDE